MSDGNEPGYTDESADAGLWARYKAAATWVKVGVPAVIIALAIGIGVLLTQGDDSSTSEADQQTEELLGRIAVLLAAKEAAGTTSVETSVVEVTTTEAIDTTVVTEAPPTEAPTTEAATTVAPPTTAAPPTAAPTTPVPPTEPSPPTADTEPVTSDTEPVTSDTEPVTSDTEPVTSDTEPVTTDTSSDDTEPPLGPGALAASLDDVQTTWNANAQGSNVPTITSWSPLDLPDETASVTSLGGNIRLVGLTDGASGPVTRLVLVWLPLDDSAQQPQQNAIYQDAFAVLMTTVNSGVTSAQQRRVAAQLGLSADLPPADDGTSADATLEPQKYDLQALDVSGVPGVDTLISVTSTALS